MGGLLIREWGRPEWRGERVATGNGFELPCGGMRPTTLQTRHPCLFFVKNSERRNRSSSAPIQATESFSGD
jgi:hypothetical protein